MESEKTVEMEYHVNRTMLFLRTIFEQVQVPVVSDCDRFPFPLVRQYVLYLVYFIVSNHIFGGVAGVSDWLVGGTGM